MPLITASFEELMKQATMTTHDYLFPTIQTIDQAFGEGYAGKNPALVGAMIQAASLDYVGTILRQGIDGLVESLDRAGGKVAEAITSPFSDTSLTEVLSELISEKEK